MVIWGVWGWGSEAHADLKLLGDMSAASSSIQESGGQVLLGRRPTAGDHDCSHRAEGHDSEQTSLQGSRRVSAFLCTLNLLPFSAP